jgi:heme-degrading monooxygenase HmoA
MYAVIFEAEMKLIDTLYEETAARMRDLALQKYGCIRFISVCEAGKEISISYWENEAQIQQWKQDEEHTAAQLNGKNKWYKNYSLQMLEVKREYSSN